MVSIIVPNYNHESFLTERIESILDQSYQNFEVIILDDCSTDNSKNIIEKYRDHPKISHIVYNEQNSGSTFKQWEKGMLLAKGAFIWIAESDDVAHPDFLTLLIQDIELDCDLIYCKSKTIDERGRNIQLTGDGYVPAFNENIISSGRDFAKTYMLKANSIPNASAVVFRRDCVDFSIFEKINKTRLLGDWIFWLDILKKNNKVVFNNKVLNDYRFHSHTVRNMSSRNEQKLLEYISLAKYVKKEIGNNNDTLDHLLYLDRSEFNNKSSFSIGNRVQIYLFFIRYCPRLYMKTMLNKKFANKNETK